MTDMTLYLIIALTPLAGCLLAGLFGNTIGRRVPSLMKTSIPG